MGLQFYGFGLGFRFYSRAPGLGSGATPKTTLNLNDKLYGLNSPFTSPRPLQRMGYDMDIPCTHSCPYCERS